MRGSPRRWRRVGLLAVAVAAVGAPFVLPKVTQFYGVLSAVYALVALSLVILSGWTGQVSLGHAAFLGTGVYIGQKLLSAGVPVPLAIVGVAAVGAALSLALGVPSLRLRGVYLTIVTLAFGAACERFFFRLRSIRDYHSAVVPRPPVLGLSIKSDRELYFLVLVVLAGALAVAANLRRSDAGRALFAIRDAEDAAQALGIKVAPYKIAAFALSAALATTAGLFYGMLNNSTPGPEQFGVLQSLFLLALPVVGGLETLAGAVAGGVFLATGQPLVNLFGVRLFLASGVLLVLVILAGVDGVTGLALAAVRAVRAQLRPDSTVRYGSFVPDAEAAGEGGRRGPRLRLTGMVEDGTVVRVRIRAGTGGRA